MGNRPTRWSDNPPDTAEVGCSLIPLKPDPKSPTQDRLQSHHQEAGNTLAAHDRIQQAGARLASRLQTAVTSSAPMCKSRSTALGP